jgi:hypothetical protein
MIFHREGITMDWVKRSSPLSDEEILQLEEQLGVKLPQGFVNWFKKIEDTKSSQRALI